MDKIVIAKLNAIIEELRDIVIMLHPLSKPQALNRDDICFVGESSDEDN